MDSGEEVSSSPGPEVWVFMVSFLLMFFGAFGLVASRVRNNRIFFYMRRGGIIGLVLFPLAILLAFIFGDGANFLVNAFSNPLSMVGSVFGTSDSYNYACFTGGKCADYCCQSLGNPHDVWKDCDAECKSKPKTVGRVLGDDCRFRSNMPIYCQGTARGVQTGQATSNVCNNIAANGPITCTCCEGGGQRWWDCNASCISHHDVVSGAAVDNGMCTSLTQIRCLTNDQISNSDQNSSTGYAVDI